MVVLSFPLFLFFISVTCCRMVIDESYESSDVGHGDDGGESEGQELLLPGVGIHLDQHQGEDEQSHHDAQGP